ncbi:MAG: hypothetical protein IPI67_31445 [Myxococcales bacterium]|nr:hypothetical protein [Myxococcales bacterium]
MTIKIFARGLLALAFASSQLACGSDSGDASGTGGAAAGGAGGAGAGGSAAGGANTGGGGGSAGSIINPLANPESGPPAGNPDGDKCSLGIPADALPEDVSAPTTVVGDGTAASCTSDAVVSAVAKGGVITFSCGKDPVVIKLTATAKIFNDKGPKIVIDGGGKVVLSGDGQRRILYMNTCDKDQVWTTSHCQDQDHPQLSIQNITFSDGNAKAEEDGGGAIFSRGGRIKLINTRFFNNVCADVGPDIGGAAVRVLSQSEGKPVYVVNSTFGGDPNGFGNSGSNGGGVSSIGVSWTIINSFFSYNKAVGNGANPAKAGTPGGGSGGAIYNDGNTMTLSLCGTLIENNSVNAHGSAIFFVTNDHSGNIVINDSVIRKNSGGSWYAKPGISMHDDTKVEINNSTLEP